MAVLGKEPVYVISIAARMVEMHPQTLRLYERLGLLKPARQKYNRLYSDHDIARLRQIQRLTQDMGVNLAGVEIILNLLEKIEELQDELEQVRQHRLPVRREVNEERRESDHSPPKRPW